MKLKKPDPVQEDFMLYTLYDADLTHVEEDPVLFNDDEVVPDLTIESTKIAEGAMINVSVAFSPRLKHLLNEILDNGNATDTVVEQVRKKLEDIFPDTSIDFGDHFQSLEELIYDSIFLASQGKVGLRQLLILVTSKLKGVLKAAVLQTMAKDDKVSRVAILDALKQLAQVHEQIQVDDIQASTDSLAEILVLVRESVLNQTKHLIPGVLKEAIVNELSKQVMFKMLKSSSELIRSIESKLVSPWTWNHFKDLVLLHEDQINRVLGKLKDDSITDQVHQKVALKLATTNFDLEELHDKIDDLEQNADASDQDVKEALSQIAPNFLNEIDLEDSVKLREFLVFTIKVSHSMGLSSNQTKRILSLNLAEDLQNLVVLMDEAKLPLKSMAKFLLALDIEDTKMKAIQRSLRRYKPSGKDTETVMKEIKEMVLLTLNEKVISPLDNAAKVQLRKNLFLTSLERVLPSSFIESLRKRDNTSIDDIIDDILEKKEVLDAFFNLAMSSEEGILSREVSELVDLSIGSEINKEGGLMLSARSSSDSDASQSNLRTMPSSVGLAKSTNPSGLAFYDPLEDMLETLDDDDHDNQELNYSSEEYFDEEDKSEVNTETNPSQPLTDLVSEDYAYSDDVYDDLVDSDLDLT